MLLKTKINLLLILLLLPISAWAIVFNPVDNVDFTLLGNTEFNYDSFEPLAKPIKPKNILSKMS